MLELNLSLAKMLMPCKAETPERCWTSFPVYSFEYFQWIIQEQMGVGAVHAILPYLLFYFTGIYVILD